VPELPSDLLPDLGSFVTWSGKTGRVDLLVQTGLVPGVDREMTGTADDPAARVVVWARDGNRLAPTGERVAVKAAELCPTGEPCPAPGGIGQLVALVAEHETRLSAHPRPDGHAVKMVYRRGLEGWPGPQATNLTCEEWALGRVRWFYALTAGLVLPGYRRDADLLPEGHALRSPRP
jgi:hypothetical protein